MVERYHRRQKRKLLSNHQKSWLWGRHTIRETLRAGRWPIVELWLSNSLPTAEIEAARARAEELHVPVELASSERLAEKCHSREHQGYLAKMGPYCYADVNSIWNASTERPLYAILDGIQDPHNLGAIIRSANVLGVDALFMERQNQVPVTSLVARSSAGAVNHVQLARVDNLRSLVQELQDRGTSVICAAHDAEEAVFDRNLRQPTAIVVGNEGTGVRPELLTCCDARIRIIQSGDVACLNAAVAAGVLFYEAIRQRSGSIK